MIEEKRSFECNSPDVIFEDFGDETILLNLKSGHYYGLDPVGMALWDLLSQNVPVAEVVNHIKQCYQGDVTQIERDVHDFVTNLLDELLLRPTDHSRALADIGTGGDVTSKGKFTAPVLSKYDDMAEMLLLDPVHDVTDQGWPNTRGAIADVDESMTPPDEDDTEH